MVGALRATMPDFNAVPSEPAATNAVHFAVTGKRNKINVVAAQGESSVPAPSPEETSSGRMKAAAWVLGTSIAIAAMLFTLMQAQGWQF